MVRARQHRGNDASHRLSLYLHLACVAFDLRQLRYFLVVAREGSLTRAAATIPVAQQSLSAQIRSLERQVGAPLFDTRTRAALSSPTWAVVLLR